MNEDCKAGEFCSRSNHVCLSDACPPMNQIKDGSIVYLNGIAMLKCLDEVSIDKLNRLKLIKLRFIIAKVLHLRQKIMDLRKNASTEIDH